MVGSPAIERIYVAHKDLKAFLEGKGELSFAAAVEDMFPKALVLAVASHFEEQVKRIVADFCAECSANHPLLQAFVASKAIDRQYHTYFDWDARNANQFFRLFGPDFKEFMSAEVLHDEQLEKAIEAFLQIGKLRNSLVHQDFAGYTLNPTSAEIYALYLLAERFVETLPTKLRQCSERTLSSGRVEGA